MLRAARGARRSRMRKTQAITRAAATFPICGPTRLAQISAIAHLYTFAASRVPCTPRARRAAAAGAGAAAPEGHENFFSECAAGEPFSGRFAQNCATLRAIAFRRGVRDRGRRESLHIRKTIRVGTGFRFLRVRERRIFRMRIVRRCARASMPSAPAIRSTPVTPSTGSFRRGGEVRLLPERSGACLSVTVPADVRPCRQRELAPERARQRPDQSQAHDPVGRRDRDARRLILHAGAAAWRSRRDTRSVAVAAGAFTERQRRAVRGSICRCEPHASEVLDGFAVTRNRRATETGDARRWRPSSSASLAHTTSFSSTGRFRAAGRNRNKDGGQLRG